MKRIASANHKAKPQRYEHSHEHALCLSECLRGSNPLSASTALSATAIKYFFGMQK